MSRRHSAKEIQPGDILVHHHRAYTVTATIALEPDDYRIPESWSEWSRKGAYAVELEDEHGIYRTVAPSSLYTSKIEILATAEDEGHWPCCSSCGQPWPCSHEDLLYEGKRMAEKVIKQFEQEQTHPYPCHWCARFQPAYIDKRFKTERGLKTHLSRCASNPKNWDLNEWVPFFSAELRVAGGAAVAHIGKDPEPYVELAAKVRQRVIDGTLPTGPNALDLLNADSL